MDDNEKIIKTRSGSLKGHLEDGVYAFRGIPYAEPPVGSLRWLPPQPVKPWNGVKPAMEFGAVAPQNDNFPGLVMNEPKDENCLFLNIWTKGIDDGRRPVMIWIHGGAFIFGSGTQLLYHGQRLARRGDVVVVSINYRMGAMGFINLEEVTGGKIPASGCEGLLDQIEAIEWVRTNISAFGGDPGNIVLFGESAGAMSIGTLMAMPSARGKFQKAIMESGAGSTVASVNEAAETAAEFLKILKIKGTDAEALRSLNTKQLMSAQLKLQEAIIKRDGRITPFHPVIDGKVLPEIPIKAIQKGSASPIKTITGSNLEEFKFFDIMDPGYKNLSETSMVNSLTGLIGAEHAPAVIDVYRRAREARGETARPGDILSAIKTDLLFRMPVINVAEAQCKNNQPAYNYLFTWKSPVLGGILGACHTLEVGFVFGNHDDTFCGSGPDADALSAKMQDAWIAFARTGNPSCESLGKWEPYCNSRKTMIFDKGCNIAEAPYETERSIWDKLQINFTRPI